MLLTLPHHAKSKNSIPIKAKEVPDFFIRLLDIWDSYSVAPILVGESQISLKVANPGSSESWVWGGVGIFFPHAQGLSKVRSILASIFGEILCDDHRIIVPIVHTEAEHNCILQFLTDFFSDGAFVHTFLDHFDVPTIMDIDAFRWNGIHSSWRLSFTFACEKSVWPLTSKKIEIFKKTIDLMGIKSRFDVQNLPQFYDLIIHLPESKLESLKTISPTLSSVLDAIVSHDPISAVHWDNESKCLQKWMKNIFPWVDVDFCQPPRNLEKSMSIFVDAEKILMLYLLQHASSTLKTLEISNFFKKHGLILTIDQVTVCLKSFEHTDSAGNSIKLQYKIKEKSRVWVLSRTTKDGISTELSINPFYV